MLGVVVEDLEPADAVVAPLGRDRRDTDRWLRRQASLGVLDRGIAGREPVAVPIGVDDHLDEVGIVE